MLRPARLAIILGLALVAVPAAGQETLGAVLDAGGKRMSAKEFETEIVQRVVVGPVPTGGEIEVMYARNGRIVGNGRSPHSRAHFAIDGEWTLDEAGRACVKMYIGGFRPPYRCQHWFKLADKYYMSDSDLDRSAKVQSRTIKK